MIRDFDRMTQPIDFEGMGIGNKTPMDIDGLIEYDDSGYIIYEFKFGDAEMPLGQRIALERLATDLQKAGKETTVLVCSHNGSADTRKAVRGADAIVRQMYYSGRWHAGNGETVKQTTDRFIAKKIQGGKHGEQEKRVSDAE